jgi:hypothetical protein
MTLHQMASNQQIDFGQSSGEDLAVASGED